MTKIIETMHKNYDRLVKSHDDIFDEFEAGIRHGYSMAITDLTSLQEPTEREDEFDRLKIKWVD